MKVETFTGEIKEAHGKTLPETLKYEGTTKVYESLDEARAANEYPNDKRLLGLINASVKANAVASARNDRLTAAGIEKPSLENSPLMRLKSAYKTAMAKKNRTKEEAMALAESFTGDSWPEGFDPEK